MQNDSSGRILPLAENSVQQSIVITPSTENDSKQKKEQKECSNYTTTMLTVAATFIAALAMFYTQQSNSLQLMNYSHNKLSLLNSTFYKGEQSRRAINVQQEFINIYQQTLTNMKSCTTGSMLSLFFGESGIGKTTILKESLRISAPFPYILIDLEDVSDWTDIGMELGLTHVNEDATKRFIFHKLSAYFESVDQKVCPIIILDGANRNIKITKSFVYFWRKRSNKGKQFGLLLLSSDGNFEEIPDAGGRMIGQELEVTTTFVKKYIQTEFGISDPKVLDTILEVAGPKMVFLEIVNNYILNGSFNVEGFTEEIEKRLNTQLNKLESKTIKNIFNIARLLDNQASAQAELEKLSTRERKLVLKSNFLKQDTRDGQVTFQNRAVERLLRKKLYQ